MRNTDSPLELIMISSREKTDGLVISPAWRLYQDIILTRVEFKVRKVSRKYLQELLALAVKVEEVEYPFSQQSDLAVSPEGTIKELKQQLGELKARTKSFHEDSSASIENIASSILQVIRFELSNDKLEYLQDVLHERWRQAQQRQNARLRGKENWNAFSDEEKQLISDANFCLIQMRAAYELWRKIFFVGADENDLQHFEALLNKCERTDTKSVKDE